MKKEQTIKKKSKEKSKQINSDYLSFFSIFQDLLGYLMLNVCHVGNDLSNGKHMTSLHTSRQVTYRFILHESQQCERKSVLH